MNKTLKIFFVIILLAILLLGNTTYILATNNKIDISKVEISNISNQLYTGSKIKPKLILKYNNCLLINNKDYKVTYRNNKKVGKATLFIEGIGNYCGTIKKYFYITPPKTKLKSVSLNNNKITLKWQKNKYADGYVIYKSSSQNGMYKKIKTINNNKTFKYVLKNIDENNTYFFKIKPFAYIKNKKVFCTKFSNIRSAGGVLAAKKLTSSSSTSNRNINLKIVSDKINGIVLKPGQKFVWSKVVGNLSEAKGYRQAIAYVNGSNVLSFGGGVCQVSSNLFQCAKLSNMKIIERHEHGKEVTYIQSGEDATVTYGLRDFVFVNNKSYSIKLFVDAYKNSTFCKFYNVGDG